MAWAKIKAVYPKKTKEMIASSSAEMLVRDQSVRNILGSTRTIDETDPLRFYKRLQRFIDSEEKTTSTEDKGPREMEFWPLIRVVKLYVKSPTLRSGVVLVDLPGVHDSNSARAAVADRYMQRKASPYDKLYHANSVQRTRMHWALDCCTNHTCS